MNVNNLMQQLAQDRPVFHTEGDFQHSLASLIKKVKPNTRVRVEYPFELERKIKVDIWVVDGTQTYVIELKYKRMELDVNLEGEYFNLPSQRAYNDKNGRASIFRDLKRVEDIVDKSSNIIGFVIFLTNNPPYWDKPKANATNASVYLEEGRIITGKVAHDKLDKPLNFRSTYNVNWHTYYNLNHHSDANFKNGHFRYTFFTVT